MKWMEQIQFQYSGDDRSSFITELLIPMIIKARNELHVSLYLFENAQVENDLCIYIVHEKGMCKQKYSNLGMTIKSALREFGLVQHSIWQIVEQKR